MTESSKPTWDEFWATINGEDWLAAKALLDLCDPVRRDASQWLSWHPRVPTQPELDWAGWVADVDERGRGWSSTEGRIFVLVAALVIPGREVRLTGTLDRLGSWEVEVWRILTTWGTGGNNRNLPGRATVVPQR